MPSEWLVIVNVIVNVGVKNCIDHETLIVFDEAGNARYRALLIDGEGLEVNANKRVPIGARLTLYLV